VRTARRRILREISSTASIGGLPLSSGDQRTETREDLRCTPKASPKTGQCSPTANDPVGGRLLAPDFLDHPSRESHVWNAGDHDQNKSSRMNMNIRAFMFSLQTCFGTLKSSSRSCV
jgi:hypothetical protein